MRSDFTISSFVCLSKCWKNNKTLEIAESNRENCSSTHNALNPMLLFFNRTFRFWVNNFIPFSLGPIVCVWLCVSIHIFFLLLLLLLFGVWLCVRASNSPLLRASFFVFTDLSSLTVLLLLLLRLFYYKHRCRGNKPPKNNFPPFFSLALFLHLSTSIYSHFTVLGSHLWYTARSKSYWMIEAAFQFNCVLVMWVYIVEYNAN